jgi:short-subunit dehydrogenase
MDLMDENSIREAIQFVIDKEGKIDILINNAGIGMTGSIEESDINDVKKIFQVNLFGMMYLIQQVLPVMRKNKSGTIINISSIAGYTGLPFRGIYSATKAAVMRITEALSAETKFMNIKVIDVAPGDFQTSIAEGRIYTELNNNSPYYYNYNIILQKIDEEVNKGMKPEQIGKKIIQILNSNSPKLRYNIGVLLQKLLPFIVTCLPGRFFEKIMINHYKK